MIACLYMENMITKKNNYFIEGLKEIKKLKYNGSTPNLLLHVCCGACSCYPLLFLIGLFKITIFFSNSNIYPFSEYQKRLNALKKYVEYLNLKFNASIELIEDEYNYETFYPYLEKYKDEEEGQSRCKICIAKRMNRLFEYASNHDYHLVSTVMTVSRNKDVNYINELGKALSYKFKDINFLVFDFKKNNGQDVGVEISKKIKIYRQDYCGCEFSLRKKYDKN